MTNHLQKYTQSLANNNSDERVQMSGKLRQLRNLLDLGKGGLSSKAGEANFFDSSIIVQFWKQFDSEVDSQENDNFDIMKSSSLKSD